MATEAYTEKAGAGTVTAPTGLASVTLSPVVEEPTYGEAGRTACLSLSGKKARETAKRPEEATKRAIA